MGNCLERVSRGFDERLGLTETSDGYGRPMSKHTSTRALLAQPESMQRFYLVLHEVVLFLAIRLADTIVANAPGAAALTQSSDQPGYPLNVGDLSRLATFVQKTFVDKVAVSDSEADFGDHDGTFSAQLCRTRT